MKKVGKIALAMVTALAIVNCGSGVTPVKKDTSSTSLLTNHSSLVRDTSFPSPFTLHSSLEFNDLEREYKPFSTKALSDAYVSRMFSKFLTTSPNPTQVIRQLEFARYLKDVKSDSSYFNSLKTFIGSDSGKFNLINNSNGVTAKKLAESATFGSFVDSLNPNIASLLDSYSGAAVAYSLRKLRSAYNGSAVRVRRSSDNTEQDFGFVNNTLDTTTLLSFVGSGNGYIVKWYDQSGNANNAIQTTTAFQPKIVNVGTVLSRNAKTCINFDNINNFLTTTNSINLTGANYAIVAQTNGSTDPSDANYIFNTPTNPRQNIAKWSTLNSDVNKYYFFNNEPYINSIVSNLSQSLYFLQYPTSSPYRIFYVNNSLATSTPELTTNLATTSKINLGIFETGNYHNMNGDFQEFTVWTSDQSSNRPGIQNNINTYYSIY